MESNNTTLNPVLQILLNGVMEQLVEALTEAVIEKLPYFKELNTQLEYFAKRLDALENHAGNVEDHVGGHPTLEPRLAQIEQRIDAVQKSLATAIVTEKVVEGIVTNQMADYVLTEDLDGAIDERLPDFEDLVNEHLPDMDDYLKIEDVQDAIADNFPSDVITKDDLAKLRITMEGK